MEEGDDLHDAATSPAENEPSDTHRIGGWVSPRAGLDVSETSKIASSFQAIIDSRFVSRSDHNLVTIWSEISRRRLGFP